MSKAAASRGPKALGSASSTHRSGTAADREPVMTQRNTAGSPMSTSKTAATAPGATSGQTEQAGHVARGAGGTSAVRQGATQVAKAAPGIGTVVTAGEAGSGLLRKHGKKVGAAGAGATVVPAVQIAIAIALLNWLKSFFMSLLAAAAHALNWLKSIVVLVKMIVKAGVSWVVGKVGGFFSAMGHGVASAFGAGQVVGTVLSWSFGASTLLTGAVALSSPLLVSQNTSQYEGALATTCVNANASANGGTEGTPITLNANQEASAKSLYDVLHGWGMPDANIAGILGNWTKESGLDPTSVEYIFDEPWTLGPRKQASLSSNPGIGIGLGGWTASRSIGLQDYAKSQGKNWYDPSVQLMFAVTDDYAESVGVIRGMITTPKGTPGEAAMYFHDHWERSADNAAQLAQRVSFAEKWYGMMSGWAADSHSTLPLPPGGTSTPGGSDTGGTNAVTVGGTQDGCTTNAVNGLSIGPGTPATCGVGDHPGAADGTMIYAGTCWYGGHGVDIFANGGNTHGTKWQCTELARRFWWAMGWAPTTWHGGVGATLWSYETPPGAISEPQGQITQLAAGDILSMNWVMSDGSMSATGHVGLVNAITKNDDGTYKVEMVSQNTPQALWYFTWDGKSLTSAFSGFPVTGVMHHVGTPT